MKRKLGMLSLILALVVIGFFATMGIIDSIKAASGDIVSYQGYAGTDLYRIQSDGSVISAAAITAGTTVTAADLAVTSDATVTGNLTITGALIQSYTTVAVANDTLTVVDCGFVNVRYATCTVHIPTAIGNTGAWYLIKHTTTSTGVVTLTPLVYGQLIDGSGTNVELDAEYDILGIFSDGANWLVWTRDQ